MRMTGNQDTPSLAEREALRVLCSPLEENKQGIESGMGGFKQLCKQSETPLYYVNVEGSLFVSSTSTMQSDMSNWHLDSLQTPLNQFEICGEGISKPMLYVSSGKGTVFAWHVEDMRLYSMNYVHAGAPKEWFIIPPTRAQGFADVAASVHPREASKCPQFVQHKMTLLEPEHLLKNDIEVCHAVQQPGQFIVILPNAYHCGINLGANVAESVNFSHRTWLLSEQKLGTPGICTCEKSGIAADGISRSQHLLATRDRLMQLHLKIRGRFQDPDHALLTWSTAQMQPLQPQKQPSPPPPPARAPPKPKPKKRKMLSLASKPTQKLRALPTGKAAMRVVADDEEKKLLAYSQIVWHVDVNKGDISVPSPGLHLDTTTESQLSGEPPQAIAAASQEEPSQKQGVTKPDIHDGPKIDLNQWRSADFKSGYVGVQKQGDGKFQAAFQHGYEWLDLGTYVTAEEAAIVVARKYMSVHGAVVPSNSGKSTVSVAAKPEPEAASNGGAPASQCGRHVNCVRGYKHRGRCKVVKVPQPKLVRNTPTSGVAVKQPAVRGKGNFSGKTETMLNAAPQAPKPAVMELPHAMPTPMDTVEVVKEEASSVVAEPSTELSVNEKQTTKDSTWEHSEPDHNPSGGAETLTLGSVLDAPPSQQAEQALHAPDISPSLDGPGLDNLFEPAAQALMEDLQTDTAPNQCLRNPYCSRGLKHGGHCRIAKGEVGALLDAPEELIVPNAMDAEQAVAQQEGTGGLEAGVQIMSGILEGTDPAVSGSCSIDQELAQQADRCCRHLWCERGYLHHGAGGQCAPAETPTEPSAKRTCVEIPESLDCQRSLGCSKGYRHSGRCKSNRDGNATDTTNTTDTSTLNRSKSPCFLEVSEIFDDSQLCVTSEHTAKRQRLLVDPTVAAPALPQAQDQCLKHRQCVRSNRHPGVCKVVRTDAAP
eukprot:TRINITY_DN1627_c0_g1_i2.p1 TRINITY_DN1627_c0_g1~~TRINITY_DN1627_c0_g1_i2.p1  ORF type:complete len:933 (-),score=119.31 TRINITY_DN1627_c0_g1_i2:227-3025(-)